MNAVVAGLPRSWQTAPSMTAICCGRVEIVDARARLVDHHAACAPRRRLRDATPAPAGSRPARAAPETALSTTPRSSASAKPIDGRGAAAAAFRSRPRCARPADRRAGSSRQSAARLRRRASSSNRAANCTRAQHAQAVVGERRADRRRAAARARDRARPSNGSKYSPVSGSHEIALTVKSRRRAASSIDIVGIAVDVEALVAAAGLRFAARQRDVDRRRACRPGSSRRPLRRGRTRSSSAAQPRRRDAEHLEVDVLRRRAPSSRSRTQPPTIERAAAGVARRAAAIVASQLGSKRRHVASIGLRPNRLHDAVAEARRDALSTTSAARLSNADTPRAPDARSRAAIASATLLRRSAAGPCARVTVRRSRASSRRRTPFRSRPETPR